jgi:hypothetical protein
MPSRGLIIPEEILLRRQFARMPECTKPTIEIAVEKDEEAASRWLNGEAREIPT